MHHLVPTVDLDSIVAPGAHKVAMPLFRPVIEIAPAIDEDVVTPPPDVGMQHIYLRKSIQQISTAEGAKAVALSPS